MTYSVAMQTVMWSALAVSFLGASGCASRRYVRNRVDDMNTKVTARINENDKKTTDKFSAVEEKQEQHETGISHATEIARSADDRAGKALQDAAKADEHAADAGRKAGDAGQKADEAARLATQAGQKIDQLGNLKVAAEESILFRFGSATLSPEEMAKLDEIAGKAQGKFFRVEVEGYTDTVGDPSYNLSLSRRRADAVARYLVSKGKVPLYRIQLMGFGEQPVEKSDGMSARDRNRLSRRVEVRIYAPEMAGVQFSSR